MNLETNRTVLDDFDKAEAEAEAEAAEASGRAARIWRGGARVTVLLLGAFEICEDANDFNPAIHGGGHPSFLKPPNAVTATPLFAHRLLVTRLGSFRRSCGGEVFGTFRDPHTGATDGLRGVALPQNVHLNPRQRTALAGRQPWPLHSRTPASRAPGWRDAAPKSWLLDDPTGWSISQPNVSLLFFALITICL